MTDEQIEQLGQVANRVKSGKPVSADSAPLVVTPELLNQEVAEFDQVFTF